MSLLSQLPKISQPKRGPGFKVTFEKPVALELQKFKSNKVPNKFGAEEKLENRRLGGLSPKLLRSYGNPARFLKNNSNLKLRGPGHVPSGGGLKAMASGQPY